MTCQASRSFRPPRPVLRRFIAPVRTRRPPVGDISPNLGCGLGNITEGQFWLTGALKLGSEARTERVTSFTNCPARCRISVERSALDDYPRSAPQRLVLPLLLIKSCQGRRTAASCCQIPYTSAVRDFISLPFGREGARRRNATGTATCQKSATKSAMGAGRGAAGALTASIHGNRVSMLRCSIFRITRDLTTRLETALIPTLQLPLPQVVRKADNPLDDRGKEVSLLR